MRNFSTELTNLKADFLKTVKDQLLNLDERWEILISTPELGNLSYRTNFGIRDDSFLYEEPCYMEKYEISNVNDILEILKDDEDFNLTAEEEITFKKYCVDGAYSRMKFDW